jgi:hypothetical protein
MKLETAPQDVQVNGDFKTSDFAVGDLAFIVDMFADKVYTYKERAVIRELACNAHDSHVVAGTTHIPFNVHLPTTLEPWFSLRDFGTGLSDQEVRTVFAGIGISTKRDSNEVIGCFGIGSLSPYSLADSFTVKSFKDGICRTYSCYRDTDRKPVVALLTEVETDEDNGLEVSVSVNGKVYEFELEATKVFKFWEGTLPNINNHSVIRECKKQREDYVFKGEDFGLTPSWGDMYAIMGNIAYRIPNELDEFDCNGYLKFELGELDFDTARENLSMNDKVRSAIKEKFQKVRSKLEQTAIDQIESETTPFKRAVLADKLRSGQLGRHIKADFDKYSLPTTKEKFDYWSSNYRSSDKWSSSAVPVGNRVEYYIHKDRMTTRIRSYLKDMGSGHTMVIFKDMAQVLEAKVDVDVIQDLDTLPKIEYASRSHSSKTNKVKTFWFNLQGGNYDPQSNWHEAELDLSHPEIIYVEISRWKPVNGDRLISSCHSQLRATLRSLHEHDIKIDGVVGLKSAFLKTKEFKKGNFIHLDDFVKREFGKIVPKSYSKFNSSDFEKISELSRIFENGELEDIMSMSQDNKNVKLMQICERIGVKVDAVEDTSLQDKMDGFLNKYEMLSLLSSWEIRQNKDIVSRYIGGKIKKKV